MGTLKQNTPPIKKNNFVVVIINAIKLLWKNYIVKPINKIKDERQAKKAKIKLEKEKAKSIENLKKNFETTFNANIETMTKMMTSQKYKQTDYDYLTNEVIKARKHIIDNNIKMGSSITDPSLLQDHNENGGLTTKSLNEIIVKDNEFSRQSLNGVDNKNLRQKAKIRWVTRE